MQLFSSSVGRKILMAISGQLMVLFVVVHLLGNSTIFVGLDWLNAYAKHLHDLGPFVWVFRISMLVLILVHILYGIQLTLENNAATPGTYAINNKLKATFSSENMIWTGLLILAFVVYHLCHFTARITSDIVAKTDALGRFDVFTMVTTSFRSGIISLIYIIAMICLFLHLRHGIQSFFQTFGWNNDRSQPVFVKIGTIVAVIFLVGYSLIPVSILAGILK
jgi:succinate dehydrogenase / fumarate reductase cytochrome b subunit